MTVAHTTTSVLKKRRKTTQCPKEQDHLVLKNYFKQPILFHKFYSIPRFVPCYKKTCWQGSFQRYMVGFKSKHLQILSYSCKAGWSGTTSEGNLGHSKKSKKKIKIKYLHGILSSSRRGYCSPKHDRMVNARTCPDSGTGQNQTSLCTETLSYAQYFSRGHTMPYTASNIKYKN